MKTEKNRFQIKFSNHLKGISTAPYLFIGSGLSNRYLEIGSWYNLLKVICQKIEMPNDFNYYYSRANQDLAKVASVVGEDFFDIWWKTPNFEDSRNAFSDKANSRFSPLKFEITDYITKMGINPISAFADEYNLFRKINIDGIITTNWDQLLENTFPDFQTFVGQENLIFNNSIDIGEIYKIHGCTSSPNSLILTEEDYENYNAKNPYLAAKLLTIFMEHPIIFLGYNIGDPNIHEILKSIITCLNRNNIEKLKDRLIFCEWSKDVTETIFSDGNILIQDTNIPIKHIKYNSLEDVFMVLSNNKRKLPIKILKHMKSMVYDYVKNSKSKSKVFITDEFDLEKLDPNKVQFFYGIGLKEQLSMVGVKGLKMQDLLIDVVTKTKNYDPTSISKHVLPNIQGKYIPYFKYLRLANILNEEGTIPNNDNIVEFIPEFIEKINLINHNDFYPTGSYMNKLEEINSKYNSIEELIATEDVPHAIIYIPLLTIDKIKIDTLLAFIKEHYDKKIKETNIKKLICLYDYMKYKLQL